MREDFSKNLFDKIESENIRPRPRWEFLLKNYFIWSAALVSLLIGSLAFTSVIYMIKDGDMDVLRHIDHGFLEFLVVALPYFWLISMAIFSFITYYNFKHTRGFYRRNIFVFPVVLFFGTIILGVLFYNVGLGKAIDDILADNMPFYGRVVNRRMEIWQDPNNGMVAGRIVKFVPGKIIITMLSNNELNVDVSKAEIFGTELKEGRMIKIIGILDDNIFQARKILPMRGPGSGLIRRFYKDRGPRVRKSIFRQNK